MRAVVLATTHRLTDQRVSHREAQSLHESGYAVRLVGRGPSPQMPFETHVVQGSIESLISRIGLARTTWFAAISSRPDIVHIHDPELLLVAALSRANHPCAVIYDSHENYDLKTIAFFSRRRGTKRLSAAAAWVFKRLECTLLRSVGRNVVVVVPRQVGLYQEVGARTALVPNYPSAGLFSRPEPDDSRSREIDVLLLGSLSPGRGLASLAGILDALFRVRPDIRITAVRRRFVERYDDQIAALVESMPQVDWIDPVAHTGVPNLLSRAKVLLDPLEPVGQNHFIYPARYFEAWSQGVPVVGPGFGYCRALIEASGAGIAVMDAGPSAYSDAILKLVDDHELWRVASGNGVRFIHDQGHTWEAGSLPELLSLYERVMADCHD